MRHRSRGNPRGKKWTICPIYAQKLEFATDRWSTFLRNHAPAIVACDFFVAVTSTFRVLYVFIVIEHHRRRLIHYNVTAADPLGADPAPIAADTFSPCAAKLEGRASAAVRSRFVPGPRGDSHAPSVGSARATLPESMAARVVTATATTGGNPLGASESAFQVEQGRVRHASRTRARETPALLGSTHRLASASHCAPDTEPADGVETESLLLTTYAAEATTRTIGSGPMPVDRRWRMRSAHRDHAIVVIVGHFRSQDRIFAEDTQTSGAVEHETAQMSPGWGQIQRRSMNRPAPRPVKSRLPPHRRRCELCR